MPEVCEIALTAQFLSKYKLIDKIDIIKYNFLGLSLLNFPLIIKEIDSYGKILWFEVIDNNKNIFYIVNTFGLKGFWSNSTGNVCFYFDIEKMFFNDSIYFGSLTVLSKKEFEKKLNSLAPDFLRTEFTTADFINWVKSFVKKNKKRENIPIVKILLEQKKSSGLGSGLGNYLVAEILYFSKLSPHKKLSELSPNQLKTLADTIKFKTKLFYMNNSTPYIPHLKKFIKSHRKSVSKGIFPNFHPLIHIDENQPSNYFVYKQKLDPNGFKIIKEEIVKGRTTYWCPSIQK